mgnify:CR=1 FL=1
MLDLLIIGAGPIGLACGIEAKKKNLKYLIVDKGVLVNSLYNYPQNMTFFSTSDRLEIGDVPFISNNIKPTKTEALEYYRRVSKSWSLKIKLYEEILNFKKTKNYFKVISSKKQYKTQNIVVATGFYDLPFLLNIPGEELSKVTHYYKDPHPYFGMNIAIIGAANSAVDVALETYRKGAKNVSLIIREKKLSKKVKYWSKPDIENRIQEGAIKSYFGSIVTRILKDKIYIKTPKSQISIKNDFVIAMTGYQPNFSLINKLGVDLKNDEFKTPVYNPKTMMSNKENVYLAGVVCGGLKTNKWFIENSRIHAEIIINDIFKKKSI